MEYATEFDKRRVLRQLEEDLDKRVLEKRGKYIYPDRFIDTIMIAYKGDIHFFYGLNGDHISLITKDMSRIFNVDEKDVEYFSLLAQLNVSPWIDIKGE